MGKRTSHHDTKKPEALATPILPVGSAAPDWLTLIQGLERRIDALERKLFKRPRSGSPYDLNARAGSPRG